MPTVMFAELGKLARASRCQISMLQDGRIVLKRGRVKLAGPLHLTAAVAYLRHELSRYSEQTAKAKLARPGAGTT